MEWQPAAGPLAVTRNEPVPNEHHPRPPAAPRAATPLTPEQRGLLFLHELDPAAALYNVPVAVDLTGPLDEDALVRAFAAVVRRHPLLGARVVRHRGTPVLVPRDDGGPALTIVEGTGTEEAHREAERAMNLATGVARATLYRLGPQRYRLLLVVHHIVFDGDSSVIVLEDLHAYYDAQFGGEPPAGVPADFGDYVRARADEVTRRGAELREFWRERVTGVDGRIGLPFDREGPVPRTRASASLPVVFGPERSRALRAFAEGQRVSPFAVLLSAYLIAVGRYEPGRRSAVAVPVGAREDPRFDRTVGYFVNMVPIREPAYATLNATGYVRWVQGELSGALDHSALPFPRIVELMPDVDPDGGNPFNCPFAFQSWYGEPPTHWAGGVRASIVESVHQKGMGHCNLTLSERAGEISGFLKYDTDRFERATAETIAAGLFAAADALTAAPDRPIAEVLAAATPVPDDPPPADVARPPAEAPPAAGPDVLGVLRAAMAELLDLPDVSDDAHFFESGGDSILAVQLVSRLKREGVSLSVRDLYRHPVLSELTRRATLAAGPSTPAAAPSAPAAAPSAVAAATAAPAGKTTAPPAPRPAPAVLLPAQVWFFDRVHTDRRHWNLSVALDLAEPVDPALLSLAVQAVVVAHPILSARFVERDGVVRMVAQEPFAAQRPRDLLRTVADADLDAELARAQRSLDPFAGRNLRAVHVRKAAGERLVLTAHHLVVDGLSWRILLTDLTAALAALEEGELPRLAPEPLPAEAWLTRIAARVAVPGDREYWREVVKARRSCATLVRTGHPGREGDTRDVRFTLDPATTTRLLGSVPAHLAMPVHDVLTGAVALALARWRGCDMVTLDVETHGRDSDDPAVDLSRTVGWLTAVDPAVLGADRALPPDRYLSAVRAALAARRETGAGYLAHRYLSADPDLADLPPALVSFNYLGQVDRLDTAGRLRPTGEPVPHERSAAAERLHPVEVYALAARSALTVGVAWSPAPADGVDEHAVAALAGQLRSVLTKLGAPAGGRDEARWPLAPQQRGLAVDAVVHPDRYVEQFHWSWHGPFDNDRFVRAWRTLHRRHAPLRGRIDPDDGPSLVAAAEVEPDITTYPGERDWADLLRQERARGVDPRRAPMLRVAVHGVGDERRILLTFHHLLLDGWSVALLIGELYRTYLDDPDPAAASEHRPDIRDHAEWVDAVDETDARRYWAQRLGPVAPATRPGLPAPAAEPTAGGTGRRVVEVDQVALAPVRDWAARLAATESTVLQTLWAALLWACTGSGEPSWVAFGVTVSGRGVPVPGIERMLGLLVNTLPLAVEVRPDEPLRALVERVREAALDLTAFEWAATGRIHEWSGRDARQPLFESLLVVENYPATLTDVEERLTAAGIRVTLPEGVGGGSPYPLSLLVHHGAGTLVTDLIHDRCRISDEGAGRLAEMWQASLLRLASPDAPELTVAELVAGFTTDRLPQVHDRPVRRGADGPGWPDGPERQVVTEAFRAVLGLADVDPDDHFFDLGGHSLLAVRLLRELAAQGAGRVRLDDLLQHPTAGALAWLLHGGPGAAPDGSLVPLRAGADPTVYLIHPPGGQVACYGELAARYPGPSRLVGIRDPRADLPGPHPTRTVAELAAAYREALPRDAQNVVLGGFSGGGVVAYELARQLAAEGRPPALVLLLDAAAPTGEVTDTEAEGSFLSQVRWFEQTRADGSTAQPSGAGPAEGLAYLRELETVAEWTRSTGRGDPFALLRDSLAAVERYVPGPYAGRVAVLRVTETDFGRGSDFDASASYYARPALGWEDHCDQLSVHIVPGNHVTALTRPAVDRLAETVAELVADATGGAETEGEDR